MKMLIQLLYSKIAPFKRADITPVPWVITLQPRWVFRLCDGIITRAITCEWDPLANSHQITASWWTCVAFYDIKSTIGDAIPNWTINQNSTYMYRDPGPWHLLFGNLTHPLVFTTWPSPRGQVSPIWSMCPGVIFILRHKSKNDYVMGKISRTSCMNNPKVVTN